MKWTSALAIYLLIWAFSTFFVLPFHGRRAEDDAVPLIDGQEPGAPARFYPLRSNDVHLTIKDDGHGFDPDRRAPRRNGKNGFGLLGMRERAAYVGGTLCIKSAPRGGTEIEVRIPAPLRAISSAAGR